MSLANRPSKAATNNHLHLHTEHISSPRGEWDSGAQFLLACIGYAVGLGNIWRFPSLAYEHGGGAFLIPYLTCSLVVGFPLLYLEMSLGQFSRCGPALAHGRIRPLFQGVGWGMAGISLVVAIYYNVIVAWVLVYIFIVITGRSGEWASCRNEFNTPFCSSSLEDAKCVAQLGMNSSAFYLNGTCYADSDDGAKLARTRLLEELSPVSPAEEFFENYVLEKTHTMDAPGLGGLNIKVVIALAVAWTLTALVLIKGVKMIGRVALFTATVPYAIILLLFARGITLDGARIGLDFYLLRPNLSVIYEPETWRAAATHLCYSLAIGFGGLLSLASFNPRHHNCFRDALIITFADGFMSLFGGTAVFAVLGFMSKQLNEEISTVVQSGTGLAFVAYPEAISRMPLSWLWGLLFFSMLFILGISSQFGLAEVMCTALYDQFPPLRRHKEATVVAVCVGLFLAGLVMATRAGVFYFTVFNDYSASFSLMLLIILELALVVYVYGLDSYMLDLRSMFGEPRGWLSRWLGPSGHYVGFVWRVVAPLTALVIFAVTLGTQITKSMTYGKDKRLYIFPDWATGLGWAITMVPLLLLPAFALYNVVKFKRKGRGFRQLLRLQPKWPSYSRNARDKTMERAAKIHPIPLSKRTRQTWGDDQRF